MRLYLTSASVARFNSLHWLAAVLHAQVRKDMSASFLPSQYPIEGEDCISSTKIYGNLMQNELLSRLWPVHNPLIKDKIYFDYDVFMTGGA